MSLAPTPPAKDVKEGQRSSQRPRSLCCVRFMGPSGSGGDMWFGRDRVLFYGRSADTICPRVESWNISFTLAKQLSHTEVHVAEATREGTYLLSISCINYPTNGVCIVGK